MLSILKRLVKDEEGQGMAEYGLLLAGIAVVVMAAVWLLGEEIDSVFDDIVAQFSTP